MAVSELTLQSTRPNLPLSVGQSTLLTQCGRPNKSQVTLAGLVDCLQPIKVYRPKSQCIMYKLGAYITGKWPLYYPLGL